MAGSQRDSPLPGLAEKAAKAAHSKLFFMGKNKIDAMSKASASEDPQKLRKTVQIALKVPLEEFDQRSIKCPRAEVQKARDGVMVHVKAVLNMILRVAGIFDDRLAGLAQQQAAVDENDGSLEGQLAAKASRYALRELEKKTRKALRAERRLYLSDVAAMLAGTPAMRDLQVGARKAFVFYCGRHLC